MTTKLASKLAQGDVIRYSTLGPLIVTFVGRSRYNGYKRVQCAPAYNVRPSCMMELDLRGEIELER